MDHYPPARLAWTRRRARPRTCTMPSTQRLARNSSPPALTRPLDLLIRELAAAAPSPDPKAAGDQVLLEQTIGEMHYILTCRSVMEPADPSLLSPRELEIS